MAALTATGVEVLLVYGAKIKPSRNGSPGIRVTAGYSDGSVLLEAVGYPTGGQAVAAIAEAHRACEDADLVVRRSTHRLSPFPSRVVFRRPE